MGNVIFAVATLFRYTPAAVVYVNVCLPSASVPTAVSVFEPVADACCEIGTLIFEMFITCPETKGALVPACITPLTEPVAPASVKTTLINGKFEQVAVIVPVAGELKAV